MGMYTEIMIKADIASNLPPIVEDVLQYLFNSGEEPTVLPEHGFFKATRWDFIGRGSSHYHIPWADSHYDDGYLFSRSDLKNYGYEIELFFDWVDPYLDQLPGVCVGYKWYEEDDVPTLVFKK